MIGKFAAGMVIDGVNPDGPAAGKLNKGDLLASIDGKSTAGDKLLYFCEHCSYFHTISKLAFCRIIFNGLGELLPNKFLLPMHFPVFQQLLTRRIQHTSCSSFSTTALADS